MWPAIMAGVSIASSVAGMAGGLSSNSKAREAAREQGRLTYNTRMREIDQLREEAEYTKGVNRAAVGASNIQFSGSAQRHINKVQEGFASDIAWRQKAAVLERSAIRHGAPGSSANLATVASGVGQIAGTIAGYNT